MTQTFLVLFDLFLHFEIAFQELISLELILRCENHSRFLLHFKISELKVALKLCSHKKEQKFCAKKQCLKGASF